MIDPDRLLAVVHPRYPGQRRLQAQLFGRQLLRNLCGDPIVEQLAAFVQRLVALLGADVTG